MGGNLVFGPVPELSKLLDFNARNSILVVEAGASMKFILRPVITVESIEYE